jgi:hypothetical protein
VIDILQLEIEPAQMSKVQQERSYIRGMGKLGAQVKILLYLVIYFAPVETLAVTK